MKPKTEIKLIRRNAWKQQETIFSQVKAIVHCQDKNNYAGTPVADLYSVKRAYLKFPKARLSLLVDGSYQISISKTEWMQFWITDQSEATLIDAEIAEEDQAYDYFQELRQIETALAVAKTVSVPLISTDAAIAEKLNELIAEECVAEKIIIYLLQKKLISIVKFCEYQRITFNTFTYLSDRIANLIKPAKNQSIKTRLIQLLGLDIPKLVN